MSTNTPTTPSTDAESKSSDAETTQSDDVSDRPAVLEADDIDHAYGTVSVLENVSTTVDARAVTALIGPNGSGKTTLLRVLAGLLEPTAGSVIYRGDAAARRIGYLHNSPRSDQVHRARDAALYSSLVGADEAETDAVDRLETVGLADAADRPVEALSGGMTRLVGIAQATIGDPPVVVLDEPASGLDPG